MTDLSVSNLIKSFEIGRNVLDGLSFTVTAGERIGILGHNGCGKTTLFRILTGELPFAPHAPKQASSPAGRLADQGVPSAGSSFIVLPQ